jgi:hypothetical protein
MDLSKLPKLSSNPEEPPPTTTDQPVVQYASAASSRPPTGVGEAWISLGVGTFLLLWQPRFIQWVSFRVFGTSFNQFLDPAGNVVSYQSLPEFWSDLGPTLFGIVLILDGLLFFTRRRGPLRIALALTVVAVAFNLCWTVFSYSKYGLAPLSALAVIFGIFIASAQWRTLKR